MKKEYKAKIVSKNTGLFSVGKAAIVTLKHKGYLWIGTIEDDCVAIVGQEQLDAIAKAWLKVRNISKKSAKG